VIRGIYHIFAITSLRLISSLNFWIVTMRDQTPCERQYSANRGWAHVEVRVEGLDEISYGQAKCLIPDMPQSYEGVSKAIQME